MFSIIILVCAYFANIWILRAFGAAGDMVLFLKDGAKVELRYVPNFNEIYNFVLNKCDAECQAKSMKVKPQA